MTTPKGRSIRLDAKRRVTLGTLVPEGVTRFRARVQTNGDIVLTPMVEVPLLEQWSPRGSERSS